MTAKEIVQYMCFRFDLKSLNWAVQIKLAKKLLEKHTALQIKYALDYYHSKGNAVYSLGFLLSNNKMKDPLTFYEAEKNMQESENSGERNKIRSQQNSQTQYRAEYPCYLFEES